MSAARWVVRSQASCSVKTLSSAMIGVGVSRRTGSASHIMHIIALMIVKPNWREQYRRIMLDEFERRRLSEEDNGEPT
jgi:hypothetical protein